MNNPLRNRIILAIVITFFVCSECKYFSDQLTGSLGATILGRTNEAIIAQLFGLVP